MALLLHWRGAASSRESSALVEMALVCERDTVTMDKMCSRARKRFTRQLKATRRGG